ncbi:MAG: hypothetical protein RL557_996 [archaeon]|jgi:GH15 family glucan-1,4-alpha-glucosidase
MLDYGIIGNCIMSALIKKNGDIDWMCYPDVASPSVFARLLDEEKGGYFGIEPEGDYTITQTYIENTNILETVFESTDYAFKIIDFFPRYKKLLGRKKLLLIKENRFVRILEPIRGIPKLKIFFQPRMDYARGETLLKEGKNRVDVSNGESQMQLITNTYLNKIMRLESLELRRRLFFVFGEPDPSEYSVKRVLSLLSSTKKYWLQWVKGLVLPEKNKSLIIRSALCLKLLTYSNTGAIVAAATTSLPEEIGSERNWDYRFCWVRDGSMTIDALCKIGRKYEAKKFMQFIMNQVMANKHIQIMYGIHGETKLHEEMLHHLSGFKHSRPVRIGNAAYYQYQHDIYGEIIDILYLYYVYYEFEKTMTKKFWEFLTFLITQIKERWKTADQGIWEFRGLTRQYTFSKLMCYIGVDRAIKIAQRFGKEKMASEWTLLNDEIKEDIIQQGYNKKREAFTIFYGSDDLDASLLLMAYHEFLPPNDQRLINTVRRIYDELRCDYLVQRYTMKDDFGTSKSAFTICSFWMVDALLYIGEKEKAQEMFDKLIANANHLGLFSEDIDIKTKKLLGNFPQAYTHIALINCCLLLSEWSSKRKKIDWTTVNRKKWVD